MRSLLFLALCATACPAATVQVYLAAGQSNATTLWASSIESELRGIAGHDNIVVAQSMHSGAWLSQWYTTAGPNPAYADDLAALEGTFESIILAGDTPELGGIFWMQGEGDAYSAGQIAIYQQKFNLMMSAYQDAFDLAALPNFTVGIIDANPDPARDAELASLGGSREQVEAMRAVHLALGQQANGSAADSRPFDRVDLWHLNGAGQVALGEAMAQEFAQSFGTVPEPSAVVLAFAGALLALRRRRNLAV